MDFSDERYVRLFVRDTPTWLSWPWEARAVHPSLLRKLDRSGRIEWPTRLSAAKAIAAVVSFPESVVETALEGMLETETIVIGAGWLEMPKYIEGQNCRSKAKTGAERTSEWKGKVGYPKTRAERAVETRGDESSPVETVETPSPAQPSLIPSGLTPPTPSPGVSKKTPGDEPGPAPVAASLPASDPTASPDCASHANEPTDHPAKATRKRGKPAKPRADYPDGLDDHLHAALVTAGAPLGVRGPRRVTDDMKDALRKLWAACEPTPEDITHVVAVRAAMTARGEEYGSLSWASICVADNFARWLAKPLDHPPPQHGPAEVSRRPTQSGVVDLRAMIRARDAAK
jgi:hypothetical protein